jgi:hypothetical protein
MYDVRQEVALHEELTATSGLGLPLGTQTNIDPAREQVLGVPLTLAVA